MTLEMRTIGPIAYVAHVKYCDVNDKPNVIGCTVATLYLTSERRIRIARFYCGIYCPTFPASAAEWAEFPYNGGILLARLGGGRSPITVHAICLLRRLSRR